MARLTRSGVASSIGITELAHVVKNYGGILTSHIRNYAEGLEDSVRELIQVGQAAAIPIHISHITAAQEPNWGKMDRVLENQH